MRWLLACHQALQALSLCCCKQVARRDEYTKTVRLSGERVSVRIAKTAQWRGLE
jgi:hypothetical protein